VEVIVPAQMFGRIIPGMTAAIVPELPEYGEQTATVTIVDKVIDSASSTFGVRLELPNAEEQMPSGLKCLVRFEIDPDAEEEKKVTARIVPGQANSK
jgi:multidrug efflux pump subunit AcrA (membrane-fusion protein)